MQLLMSRSDISLPVNNFAKKLGLSARRVPYSQAIRRAQAWPGSPLF